MHLRQKTALCCAIGRGNTGGWLPVNPTWHKQSGLMSAPTFHVVRFSCQGLPHNAILPQPQHPQQRKHRPDSPKRVCQKRDSECKNGNILRFWHDAVLVFSCRSFPAAMLDHHSPPVGRAISVCRRKRRQIAICGRFPDPVRCVCWHCLLTKPDAYPTHGRSACCSGWFASWPGSQDGQRMSQTDFSDSLQPAGHCDRVSPNPDNAHAVEVLRWPDAIPA